MEIMKGMILAAGYGERLWPLTADRTKPALPVLGKPLVGYVAEYLARFGFNDIVVNLHHYPDSVRKSLGDGSRFGVRLEYVHEPVILGTSGALDNARPAREQPDQRQFERIGQAVERRADKNGIVDGRTYLNPTLGRETARKT